MERLVIRRDLGVTSGRRPTPPRVWTGGSVLGVDEKVILGCPKMLCVRVYFV